MRVIITSPGTFIPDQHEFIKAQFEGSLVAVAEHSPRIHWVIQELNVPISVTASALVLLRNPGFKDADCIGLEDELSHLSITRKCSHRPDDLSSEAKRKRVELPAPPSNDKYAIAPSVATGSAGAGFDVVPVPEVSNFPMLYVCDMHDGTQVLHTIAKEAELKAEFLRLFSGMKYHCSTVCAACTLFCHAKGFGFIDKFVDYGRTNSGKWSALREVVNIAMKGEYKHHPFMLYFGR